MFLPWRKRDFVHRRKQRLHGPKSAGGAVLKPVAGGGGTAEPSQGPDYLPKTATAPRRGDREGCRGGEVGQRPRGNQVPCRHARLLPSTRPEAFIWEHLLPVPGCWPSLWLVERETQAEGSESAPAVTRLRAPTESSVLSLLRPTLKDQAMPKPSKLASSQQPQRGTGKTSSPAVSTAPSALQGPPGAALLSLWGPVMAGWREGESLGVGARAKTLSCRWQVFLVNL